MMSPYSALNWIEANCPFTPVRDDFEKEFLKCVEKGSNCVYSIGAGLICKGAPYLLCWFASELYLMQLTHEQARAMNLAPNVTRYAQGGGEDSFRRIVPPSLSLNQLAVEPAGPVDPRQPWRLSCQYKRTSPLPPLVGLQPGRRRSPYHPMASQGHFMDPEPHSRPPSHVMGWPAEPDDFLDTGYCLRLTFISGNGRLHSLFSYPFGPLSIGGTLHGDFPQLTPPDQQSAELDPIFPAFLTVCNRTSSQDPGGHVAISNLAAILITLKTNP